MIHIEELLLNRKPEQRLKQFVKSRLNGRCIYCGNSFDRLTCDHIKPRSKGGKTTHYNLVPACIRCNESKGSMDVFEWWQTSPYWLDAIADHRVDLLIQILDDERSFADWLIDLVNNPMFRIEYL